MTPNPPHDDRPVNVAVLFPPHQHQALKAAARAEDITVSQLVRRLARDYLTSKTVSADHNASANRGPDAGMPSGPERVVS